MSPPPEESHCSTCPAVGTARPGRGRGPGLRTTRSCKVVQRRAVGEVWRQEQASAPRRPVPGSTAVGRRHSLAGAGWVRATGAAGGCLAPVGAPPLRVTCSCQDGPTGCSRYGRGGSLTTARILGHALSFPPFVFSVSLLWHYKMHQANLEFSLALITSPLRDGREDPRPQRLLSSWPTQHPCPSRTCVPIPAALECQSASCLPLAAGGEVGEGSAGVSPSVSTWTREEAALFPCTLSARLAGEAVCREANATGGRVAPERRRACVT